MMSVKDSEMPLTEEVLRATEKRLGVLLPTQYRSLLLIHNECRPIPDVFKFRKQFWKICDLICGLVPGDLRWLI